ncbi:DUF6809 family protein [Paenibacillus macerans]|uniref:DUF6809 family protein n=1 Tax=Paenibacillus macerans TaxID=44252 RepID=UPI0020402840|nr:DUF6809 family protein [Paenibacillus macerans]MCM3698990.1 hypothetical protein [Paenibacillus macerans]
MYGIKKKEIRKKMRRFRKDFRLEKKNGRKQCSICVVSIESIYATATFINGFQLGADMMMEIYAAKEELLYDLR